MNKLPKGLAPLAEYNQFILWRMDTRNGKPIKAPLTPAGVIGDSQDPANWMDAETALYTADVLGVSVGFVFTEADPFYFLDIDKCKTPGGDWSALATDICASLPGAAVELSQSSSGLHIFGKSAPIEHACKNVPLGIELYTAKRFVALTGEGVVGDASLDCTANLAQVVARWFPPKMRDESIGWDDGPVEGYNGPADDEELLVKMLAATSGASMFGGGCTFRDLWEANEDVLAGAYPADPNGGGSFDGSSADAALAAHLAFWTGKDCARMERLMRRSSLAREKWSDRDDYLQRTINFAVSVQETVYGIQEADATVTNEYGAGALKGSSEAQVKLAEAVRSQKLAAATPQEREVLCAASGPVTSARFWLDTKEHSPHLLAAQLTPSEDIVTEQYSLETKRKSGAQLLTVEQQVERFNDFAYVIAENKIMTDTGKLLGKEAFNAAYGGYEYLLDDIGERKTKHAWDAFTQSHAVRHRVVHEVRFNPLRDRCEVWEEEGVSYVNSYLPISTKRIQGDASPFIDHMARLLPDANDREILLSYAAACVQHKGQKFKWAPFIQGVAGNGKTIFLQAVRYAVGARYSMFPLAKEISEKFNPWLFGNLFIGVEDVLYNSEKGAETLEVLKPMITNSFLAKRAMRSDQVMDVNYANFMLTSNYKDAIRKTEDDRRYAVFFTAQQTVEDLERDGMDSDYFNNLIKWLEDEDGYAVVNEYLSTYPIAEKYNPLTTCKRAPETTSTKEALGIGVSVGDFGKIYDLIHSEGVGFRGGFVSSSHILYDPKPAIRGLNGVKLATLMRENGYMRHPALEKDRHRLPNKVEVYGEQKRTTIYIKEGSPLLEINSPADLQREYLEQQRGEAVQDDKGVYMFKEATA